MAAPDVNPDGPVFGPIRPVPGLTPDGLMPGGTLGNHWQNRSRGNSTRASPVATFSPAWFFTTTSINTQRDFSVDCLALIIPEGGRVAPGGTGLTHRGSSRLWTAPAGQAQSVSIREISPKLFMPCMMMPPKLVLPKLPFM